MADGSITFDTSVDTKGINKASTLVTASFKRMNTKIKSAFGLNTVDKAAEKVTKLQKKYDDATEAVKRQEAELDKLNAKMKELNSQSDKGLVEPPEAQLYIAQAERLKAQLEEAKQKSAEINSTPEPMGKNAIKEHRAEQAKWSKEVDSLNEKYQKVLDKIQLIETKAATSAENKRVVQLEDVNAKIAKTEQQIVSLKEKADSAKASLNEAIDEGKTEKFSKSISGATTNLKHFGKRLAGITKSALIFSVLYKALNELKKLLTSMAKSDPQIAKMLGQIKGNLLTAFQPIYEACLPAIKALMSALVKVTAMLARFAAALSGKSTSQMQKNAEALYEEANATTAVGKAAKEATKSLIGLDEINQMSDNSNDGGSSIAGSAADFSSDLGGLSESLEMTIEDVFFDWDDLTGEQIAQKIIVGLGALLGGVIGFSIGGVPGAIIGGIAGVVLGLLVSSVTFDHDGKLSEEEILKMIILALGGVAGGVIGFTIGGPMGAVIGISIGAALGFIINSITFDGDSKLSSEEILKMIGVALGLIGGVIGFVIGGPAGAALGLALGLFLGDTINSGEMKELGTSLIDGFIEGWNSEGTVGERLLSAFKNALTAIKNFFGIHSPSTVFAELGRNIIQGLINGIVETKQGIIDTFVRTFNSVKASAQNTWNSIKTWFTQNVAPKFTVDYWKSKFSVMKDGAKSAINGIIALFEKGINNIITRINRLSWEIPDWVPGVGGSRFGFNIPTVSLPRLATGTVVPKNYGEFAAILGDNKRETEVVSPLSTMKQAFKEAMSESGGAGGDWHIYVMMPDGTIKGEAIITAIQRINQKSGRTVIPCDA